LLSRNNDRPHHVGARGHERRRTSRAPDAAAARRAQRAEPFAGDDEALDAAGVLRLACWNPNMRYFKCLIEIKYGLAKIVLIE
jgi:hypothetical protein